MVVLSSYTLQIAIGMETHGRFRVHRSSDTHRSLLDSQDIVAAPKMP
jgi:hypothetical protein